MTTAPRPAPRIDRGGWRQHGSRTDRGAARCRPAADERPSPSWRSSTLGVSSCRRCSPSITVTSHVPLLHRAALLAVKRAMFRLPRDAAAGATRMLSIATGVRLATIEAVVGPASQWCGPCRIRRRSCESVRRRSPVASVQPTTTSRGRSRFCTRSAPWRMSEGDLDLFTGVAGSGPAYIFLVAEAVRIAFVPGDRAMQYLQCRMGSGGIASSVPSSSWEAEGFRAPR